MKILNTFLALMGATLLSANALADPEAPSQVDYDVNGDGIDEKAYELKSVEDLYWFADLVNGKLVGVTQNKSANAFLANNITVNNDLFSKLNEDGTVKSGEEVKEWFPIGYFYDLNNNGVEEDVCFYGTFDGNGHTISGLYFNNEGQSYVGLFGQTFDGATIKNVGVIDSYIKGESIIGGVCGYNYGGTIENCYNSGKVSGSKERENIGGVCGYNLDTIENCYNSGEVSGDDESRYIGGVCGNNWGAITNCYNSGKVSGGNESYYIGGVCGDNGSTITNCYNIGKVSGGNKSSDIGGVCGYNVGTIENCYYLASTDDGNGGKTADQFADGTVAQALRNGTNGNVWGQYIGVEEAPTLCGAIVNPTLIAEGEYIGYYAIGNADELYWFAKFVNKGGDNAKANAVLTANITVNKNLLKSLAFDENGNVTNGDDFKAWFPIGYYNNTNDIYYSGTFNGNGHTISGLYFNNENQGCVGLFGQIDGGATIKNVGVIDSYFKGESNIGGVCGYNYYGTIENCHNTGKVEGSNFIGGVCGDNFGTIENCYNTGKVEGSNYIGGVCGSNWGTIENCYNTGKVEGSNYIGGVCGCNDGTIENCYDFKLNSGTLSEYSIVVENNTIALPTEDMVSREGYQFGGWCTDEACEGEGITSEVEFDDVHTLYAKWTGGSTPTAIKAVEAENNKTIKTIKDGQIVIIRNGVMYDMNGRKL